MSMILAGDTGGSKTEIRIYDSETDQILHRYSCMGFGSAADSEEPIPVLSELLAEITSTYSVSRAAVNLGGKNKTQIFQVFRKAFPAIPLTVCRESEGDAAFALCEKHKAQIIVLCGTGSIGLGVAPDGRKIVCGGWGMNIGDNGSGYDIGLTAIRRSLEELDGTEPLSQLAQRITGCCEPFSAESDISVIRDMRDSARSRILPLDRKKTAEYARTVSEYCRNNDPAAMRIMRDAGAELGNLVLRISDKLGRTNIHSVILTGGLIHSLPYWQSSFESQVRSGLPDLIFQYRADGIIEGTYYIAKAMQ
ncbi:MAG: hypothetical protein K6D94_12605 [Clostridiales bacterium]|nr:hypothetical protein [Clostridiales bacterium]